MSLPTQEDIEVALVGIILATMPWSKYAPKCIWNQGGFCTARYCSDYEKSFPSCYDEGCTVYDNIDEAWY